MPKFKKVIIGSHEKYQAAITKVRSKRWSGPLGKTMSFTGHILKLAGKSGAPFAGMLGSALIVGSQVKMLTSEATPSATQFFKRS